jgi:hypothetical protein
MTSLLADLADLVDELCDPHQHVERVHDRVGRGTRRMRAYVTVQQGLLAQLAAAAVDGAAGGDEPPSARPIPQSRPPGCFEALARHTAITLHVARWCWDLRIAQRDTVEGNMRALVGAAGGLDGVVLQDLVAAAKGWRHQAAVMTGWASPRFAPDVPCPSCERRGTIRINLSRQVAMCTSETCGALWEADTIGVLADYIRQQTESDRPSTRPTVRSGRAGHGAWLGDVPDHPNG